VLGEAGRLQSAVPAVPGRALVWWKGLQKPERLCLKGGKRKRKKPSCSRACAALAAERSASLLAGAGQSSCLALVGVLAQSVSPSVPGREFSLRREAREAPAERQMWTGLFRAAGTEQVFAEKLPSPRVSARRGLSGSPWRAGRSPAALVPCAGAGGGRGDVGEFGAQWARGACPPCELCAVAGRRSS